MIVYCILLVIIGEVLQTYGSNEIFEIHSGNRLPVYWNIPTFQCDSHNLNFTTLAEKYGIEQNKNDTFRGDKIVILYDPGSFPAILTQGSDIILRNGGVPQEGNLSLHISMINDIVNELIPDEEFQGVGILDFESWRPVFRQNFGSLLPYKNLSYQIESKKHPNWPQSWIEKEAKERFEESGRTFVVETLTAVKKLRPKASWGYYAYPYCFNMSPGTYKPDCPKEVKDENDMMQWLFDLEENLYPSVYFGEKNYTEENRVQLIEGRVGEANRIRKLLNSNPKIIPYYWYKYHDTKTFLSRNDVFNTLTVLGSSDIDGLILWGSSADVNTKEKCIALYEFMDDTFGPILINSV